MTAPANTPHDSRVGFVLRLGQALHTYGTPSHRLEDTLVRVSDRLEVPGQFFATPTSIFASFGAVEQQRTHLLRLEPGETSLEKLAAVDAIGGDVIAGHLSPAEGSAAIDAVVSMPSRYSPALTLIAFGLLSAAAAQTQVPPTLSSSSPGVTLVGATALRKESSPALHSSATVVNSSRQPAMASRQRAARSGADRPTAHSSQRMRT